MPRSAPPTSAGQPRPAPSRRTVIAAGIGAAVATVARGGRAHAAERRLRFLGWGSTERGDRTARCAAIHARKTPGVTVETAVVVWSDYWPRLAAEVAAGTPPDIVQMDYRYLADYTRRGALLPLDDFVGQPLDLSDFGVHSLDSGRVNGKLYGVNLGNNSAARIQNLSLYRRLHLSPPGAAATWAQFAAISAAVHTASGGRAWGSTDAGGAEGPFECWLRQRGKVLYTSDGKAGFAVDDVAEWFAYWDAMRKTGGCVPPALQAADNDTAATSSLILGRAASIFANANQLVGYQAQIKDRLGLAMYPVGEPGSRPGQYLKPSMFFCIAATSPHAADAAAFIQFCCRDPDAVKTLSVERGVPASAASRLALAPTLDEPGRATLSYIAEIAGGVGPLPPAPPARAGDVYAALRHHNAEIGFGRSTVRDAARHFHDTAVDALERG